MSTFDFRLAAAEAVIRQSSSEKLKNTARDLLKNAAGSDNLRQLARFDATGPKLTELVSAALIEIGGSALSKREALLLLSTEIAKEILGGTLSPLVGAEQIWRLSIDVPEQVSELSTFIYAALEAEDRSSEELKEFERGIVEASRDLVAAM